MRLFPIGHWQNTAVTYLLRDTFTTTASAPLTSPRTCEPTGTLTIVDTTNTLSISGAQLAMTAGPGSWGNPSARSSTTVARADGRALLCKINKATGGTYGPCIGFSTNTAQDVDSGHFDQGCIIVWVTNQFLVRISGTPTQIGSFSTNTDYTIAVILHTSGWIACVAGGAYATFPQMTVKHISTVTGTTNFYPALTTYNAAATFDDLRVVDLGGSFASDSYYSGLSVNDVITLPSV